MKSIISLILFILLTCSAFAQEISQSNVPAVVLNNFQLKYPNADDVNWKLDKGKYKINFKLRSKTTILTMDFKGNVLELVQEIFINDIPKSVLEIIRDKITNFDIAKVEKYVVNNKTSYEIQFKIDGKNNYFYINEKGELVKYRKELKDTELPLNITKIISDQFGTFELDRSKYVEDNGNTNYIIRGYINSMKHAFWFSDKAILLKHTQDLKRNEIPDAIINLLKLEYSDYELRDAEMINERGKKTYLIVIKKSSKKNYLTFSSKGKILATKRN